jgi:hypothetical protein
MSKLIINMAVDINEQKLITEGKNDFQIEIMENNIKTQLYSEIKDLLTSFGEITNLDVDIITEDNAEDKILEKMRKAMEGALN